MGYDCLINGLVSDGVLVTPSIIKAFRTFDRKNFCREGFIKDAYEDRPLPIGHGQTISQPTTVAMMMELLQPGKDDDVLDVGSGSGWTTAILSNLSKRVYGVEKLPELVEFGRKNIIGIENASITRAGGGFGLPEQAPFDKILVSAAADKLPQELVDQLDDPGRMVIPIRSSIWLVEKAGGEVDEKEFYGFSFVPLR